jgi:hypothetical protein
VGDVVVVGLVSGVLLIEGEMGERKRPVLLGLRSPPCKGPVVPVDRESGFIWVESISSSL